MTRALTDGRTADVGLDRSGLWWMWEVRDAAGVVRSLGGFDSRDAAERDLEWVLGGAVRTAERGRRNG